MFRLTLTACTFLATTSCSAQSYLDRIEIGPIPQVRAYYWWQLPQQCPQPRAYHSHWYGPQRTPYGYGYYQESIYEFPTGMSCQILRPHHSRIR